MAVLIEAWSVLVRRDAIDARFNGGWSNFLRLVPNRTLCMDTNLARVAFISWEDAESYIRFLASHGLVPANDEHWLDMVALNHIDGIEHPVPWLKTATTTLKPNQTVLVGWLSERQSSDSFTYFPTDFSAPEGWTYEDSLMANGQLIYPDNSDRYTLVRQENGVKVYLDRDSGKEIFVGHT